MIQAIKTKVPDGQDGIIRIAVPPEFGTPVEVIILAQTETGEETSAFEFVTEDGTEYRLAEWTEEDFNRESAAGAVRDDGTTVQDLFDV